MPRPNRYFALAAASLFLLGVGGPVRAVIVGPATPPVKAAHADLIVTGKVTAANDPISAAAAPAVTDKFSYQVFQIQVAEVLNGKTAKKTVRVGFAPPAKPGSPRPKAGQYGYPVKLGQEGLFYLKKHHAGDFYFLPMPDTFVPAQNKAFMKVELEEARLTLNVMENPLAGLKAEDIGKRLETVYILMNVYHIAPIGATYKVETLDAEQSKLILKTLLDADWDFDKYKGDNYRQDPTKLFDMLRLTPKQGFQDPKKGIYTPEYTAVARNWLTRNWQTYRLQRVVIE